MSNHWVTLQWGGWGITWSATVFRWMACVTCHPHRCKDPKFPYRTLHCNKRISVVLLMLLIATWGLLHTSMQMQRFTISFFSIHVSDHLSLSILFFYHLPLVARGDNFIKMDGSVCSGAGGALCLMDLNVFFPSRCWLIASCLVMRLGNSLLWSTVVLLLPDTVVCRSIQVSNAGTVAWASKNR